MWGKLRSVSTLTLVLVILIGMLLVPIFTPVVASDGVLNGDGIKWRSYGLYRSPLGVDADGNVYALIDQPGDPVSMYDPTLISLDANGSKRWEYEVTGTGQYALIDSSGRSYLLESNTSNHFEWGQERTLTVLDRNGAKLVSLDLLPLCDGRPYFRLLASWRDVLYIAALEDLNYPVNETWLYAIDLSGEQLWSSPLSGAIISLIPPSENLGWSVVATNHGVYQINTNGTIVKSVNMTDANIIAGPVVSPNGTTYVAVHHGDQYLPNEIWAISPEGEKMWGRGILPEGTYTMGCQVWYLFRSSDGTLYVTTSGGYSVSGPSTSYDISNGLGDWIQAKLLAIDQNGQLKWTYDLGGDSRGEMVEMDEKIVMCITTGILVLTREGALSDRYIPSNGYITGMTLTSAGHFYYTESVNSNYALAFSEGLPRATIADILTTYQLVIIIALVVPALSVAIIMYRRRRRK